MQIYLQNATMCNQTPLLSTGWTT